MIIAMQRETEIVIARVVVGVELPVAGRIVMWRSWKECVVGGRGEFEIDSVGLLGSCSVPGSARHLSEKTS